MIWLEGSTATLAQTNFQMLPHALHKETKQTKIRSSEAGETTQG